VQKKLNQLVWICWEHNIGTSPSSTLYLIQGPAQFLKKRTPRHHDSASQLNASPLLQRLHLSYWNKCLFDPEKPTRERLTNPIWCSVPPLNESWVHPLDPNWRWQAHVVISDHVGLEALRNKEAVRLGGGRMIIRRWRARYWKRPEPLLDEGLNWRRLYLKTVATWSRWRCHLAKVEGHDGGTGQI
jgi:hypothetical protein